jgi:hypothetical protein
LQNCFSDQLVSKIENLKNVSKTIENIKEDLFIALKSDNPKCLWFLFPFIERVSIELLVFFPDFDIEHYSQGTYRTLASILKDQKNEYLPQIFGPENYHMLCKYYVDNNKQCLRNLVCHISDLQEVSTIDIDNVKILACNLLIYLDRLIMYRDQVINKKVEFIDNIAK